MIKKSVASVFVLAFLFVFAGTYNAHAALSKQLSYQGRLQNAAGQPVADGTYTVVFSIYNVSTGGSALYTETQNVTVDKGGFSAYIGSVTPLNLPFNEDYFLGIKVGADPEMTPRLKLAIVGTSVFALDAGNAANLGGQLPSSFAPATHTHTITVGSPEIIDGSVTGSDVDATTVQKRVTGTCAGNVMVAINQDGTVTCEPDDGGGGGGTPASTVTSIGTSNVVGTSTNFAREDHVHNIPAGLITDAMINASAGIAKSKLNLTNSILFSDIAQNGCASGQVVEWNGSAWVCGTDDTAGGGAVVNNPGATQTIIAGNSTTTPIVLKGAAGTSVPMFEVQDSAGAIKLGVMPDGHVYIPSTNQLHVKTVNNDSPSGSMGDMTVDVMNAAANSKLIVTNSDPTYKASLDVEGQLLVGLPTDTAPKVSVETLGAAPGIAVKHTGTGTAVDAWNSGTAGSAVVASQTNAGNASDLIAGDTSGTGNLLKLSQSGVNKMVVSNTGLITTPSVNSASIADSTIVFADVAPNGCAGGQVFEYNGSAWVCGTDDTGAGGTVTNVATGTGLTGGPITATGTISIASGGVTTTEIADSTISNVDIAAGAGIAASKIAAGTFAILNPAADQTIVSGGAAVTPLIVKAAAAPSVNIFDVQDNAAASLLKVMSGGNVMIGSSPSSAHMLNIGTSSGSLIIYGNQAGGGNLMALAQGGLNKFLVQNNGDLSFGSTAPSIIASGVGANITLNANDGGASTVTVTNSGAGLAKLSVEGGIQLGGDIVKIAAGTTNIDLQDAGTTVLNITNAGVGTALLQVEGATVVTSASGVITNPASTQSIVTTSSGATPLIVKGTAGQSVNIFDVQDNASTSRLTVNSTGQVIASSAGNLTLDANAVAPTIVSVTNTDVGNVANLSVEGNVLLDGGQVKKNTAGVLALATTGGGIQLDAFQAGPTNVQIVNTDAGNVANIDLEGDLIRNGSGTFTIKNSTGNLTLDATAVAPTVVSVTNTDVGNVANLSVEGNVLVDGGQVKKNTAGLFTVGTSSGGIELDALNAGGATNVRIVNTDGVQVANIDLEGDLIRNGTGTFIVKNSTGNLTLDATAVAPTVVSVTNTDVGNVANLSVEGNVLLDGGQVKKNTAGVLALATTSGGIQLDAFDSTVVTNVQIVNTDATKVANIDLEGDLTRNGTGTFTVKNSTGNLTLDAFAVAPTIVTVTNTDAGNVANLSVEGNVLIGPGSDKAVVSPAATLQKVQSGKTCESLATDGFINITYPAAYGAAPVVTGILDKNGNAAASTGVFIANPATDVTATTAKFTIWSADGVYIECVQWIAVGN